MWNIPNLLTLFRLFLIPVFILCFYSGIENARFWAAFVFWLAAITDALDGYLARKLQQSTPFGAFLDPVADKVMVAVALVLIAVDSLSLWVTVPAIIMISREIVISALREWMAELGKRANVAVSNLGKYKTIAQMLALIGLIWRPEHWLVSWFSPVGMLLLYIATVLTIWSMYDYLRAAWRDLVY
ncbi:MULTISPECIES: CDP-diacylglycerol--glycerol-3-phosphate 3-phosphatidyltransferase [Rheinheimera]|jgi:CDP-diacylglycerol--glycerol-3-phosphate 3-phosphatidyltransferase|uniref:CDP-diacylglycerol--glycerol-3-phosphate 3-phosphatidyltransferase n=1 Tax=Rheinheimera aquimaris TaxID=412437 RepID=A0ABN1DGP8_9GAMM|nr:MULTISPECIES: CDP-diacylglycerol--glycerol-3-phosphate 3-phosphatidyltransferase [Rheinheimera]MCB5211999.1 CDP-diacylglycerol--glycerol-3-phosphate 3-phosphatidyltransferase [Rheinheimera aquimaris]MCD1600074.1 CDP-diacylglycerol--glycerol-3-phosphate 3-phosphatidyltransferase [Rheinheimera aquimaris]HBN90139.1 CDP-diacylglycerol--glycerol-3-phosphate 3-phosphatidyltransferase [Rheinheimera sp.]|tara:strand:- start:390 stop:944 length:555 start_codon:yes stop_codon:yes gene_type:complete